MTHRTEYGRDWTLHNIDCLEWMAAQPEASVDHVICDPPYDQHTSECARTIRGAINNKRAVADERMGRSRYVPFDGIDPRNMAQAVCMLARRWAIAFCSLEQLGAYQIWSSASWVRAGVWHRLGGAPQFTGDRPAQACEGVAIMHRPGRKRWNGGGGFAVWTGPRMATGVQPMAANRVHPTQKPEWLMLALVRLFTDEGELVCDPFAGSGTTGVACLRLGRRFVGCELDDTYFDAAVERLRAEENQTTIGQARAGQMPLFGVKP